MKWFIATVLVNLVALILMWRSYVKNEDEEGDTQ